MQVKRYEAATMREALVMIKKDLGPDAVVLSTKKITVRGRPSVEVMAARDLHDIREGDSGGFGRREGAAADNRDELASLKADIGDLRKLVTDMRGIRSVQGELMELRETLDTVIDGLGMQCLPGQGRGHLADLAYRLIGNGVSKARTCSLMETLRRTCSPEEIADYDKSIGRVEQMIGQSFPATRGAKRRTRIKVFVGPTGVGKTTTLAKLAARYALNEKMNVGLITTDTYRIAAAEQLRTYAKIIGIPLAVVSEKEHFQKTLSHFTGKDMILVDTPGKSRKDEQALEKLKDLMAVDVPLEASLLLSLTSSEEAIMDAAKRFRAVDYSHIIFTKLDECARPGFIYDLVNRIGKPVSYITNGQNVPHDIEQATPASLTKLVMGEGLH